MTDLPRPDFIDRDPELVEREAIALYESLTQKTLYPAQPERLLLDVLAYRETLTRLAIQDAAEQNLVNYARGVNLDQLGALLDVVRLPESKARTTLQFTKATGAIALSVVVPAGTRASTQDGEQVFETEANLTIPAGQASGSVFADCTLAGAIANNLEAGQVSTLVDLVPSIASVTNTTKTNGGAAVEGDDRFRERVKLAPNKFSVAGSYGAYLYWILTADQTISDAAILSPFRVQVDIYPLTSSGLPTAEILDKVRDVVTASRIRPLTDNVTVLSPTAINYSLIAEVTLYSDADVANLQDALNQAAADFATLKRSRLGQDVPRSQAIAALSLPGVYAVSLVSPSVDLIVEPSQWANCINTQINIVGTNNG